MSRILHGGRFLWLAWYPKRGRRCQLRADLANYAAPRGRYLEVAVGPAYLLLGTGTPEV